MKPYPYASRRPQSTPEPSQFPTLTVADVQKVERDRVLTELRRRILGLATEEHDTSRGYGTKPISAGRFRNSVESILHELEVER